MDTKKCPKCSESIQGTAKKCKHCQADLRSWFVRHKILTGIGIFFLLAVVGSALGDESSSNKTTITNENGEEVVVDNREFVDISCYDFHEIFGVNSDLTDLQKDKKFEEEYDGMYVEWEGEVSSISDSWGSMSVQIKCHPDVFVSNVIISFNDDQADKLLDYSEGDNIRFTGKLNSWGALLSHSLSDGQLVDQ